MKPLPKSANRVWIELGEPGSPLYFNVFAHKDNGGNETRYFTWVWRSEIFNNIEELKAKIKEAGDLYGVTFDLSSDKYEDLCQDATLPGKKKGKNTK